MRRAGGLVCGWRLATRVVVAAAGMAMLVSGSGATAAAPTPRPILIVYKGTFKTTYASSTSTTQPRYPG